MKSVLMVVLLSFVSCAAYAQETYPSGGVEDENEECHNAQACTYGSADMEASMAGLDRRADRDEESSHSSVFQSSGGGGNQYGDGKSDFGN